MGKFTPKQVIAGRSSFFKWLESLEFNKEYLQESFKEYLSEVYTLKAKVEQMDAKIEEIAQLDLIKDKVDKLVCFPGINIQTAVAITVEIGDFQRFANAQQFSSFLGLCPGEDSSGKTIRKLGITKAGNSRLRKLFSESAKAIKMTNTYGKKSRRILERQRGSPVEIIVYADKAAKRIREKMRNMENRGKHPNVSSMAGARELACFVWGMMTANMA